MNKRQRVSIVMITYNHEKFIKKSLDGVFSQITNYDIEYIISDDNSSDQTAKIITDYLNKKCDSFKISFIKRKKNLGMLENALKTIKEATGDYIAFCEGDDVWCDNKKVEKQVNLLKNNKKLSMTCSNVFLIDTNDRIIRKRFEFDSDFIIDINYLLKNNHISTCSVMFKTHLLDIQSVPKNINFLDKFLWFDLLSKGNCIYSKEIFSHQRINPNGTYTSLKLFEKSFYRINDYKLLKNLYPSLGYKLNKKLYKDFIMGLLSALKRGNTNYLVKLLNSIF